MNLLDNKYVVESLRELAKAVLADEPRRDGELVERAFLACELAYDLERGAVALRIEHSIGGAR
jgi:hypothetical protein